MAMKSGADLRFCGICWRGEAPILHYCDGKLGHDGPHRCHCGAELPGPVRLAPKPVIRSTK